MVFDAFRGDRNLSIRSDLLNIIETKFDNVTLQKTFVSIASITRK